MKKITNKGFTLLEILLVIAAIGILASIVIVAINPLRQISKVENASRWSNINTLQKALDQYNIANGKYPDGISSGSYKEVCDTGGESVGGGTDCITTGKLDLRVLVPQYIAEIPRDPNGGGYKVGINTLNNQISVWADKAKLEELVSINLFTPISIASTFVKKAGGPYSYNEGRGVATYSNGDSVVVGSFQNEITFGEGSNQVTLISRGGLQDNIFIAKYDANSNLIFAKGAGGAAWYDRGYSVDTYNDGSSIITGEYHSQAIFGEGVNEVTLNAPNTSFNTAFVAKYDNNGNLVWAKNIAGNAMGYSITSYNDQYIFITGQFFYTTTFGEGGNSVQLTVQGTSSTFIAKYDDDGNMLWAKSAGSANTNYPNAISTYSGGGVLVGGSYMGVATFGEGVNQEVLTSSGPRDLFIVKYDDSGNMLWVKSVGGSKLNTLKGITAYDDGSLIITGSFSGNSTFGDVGNQITINSVSSWEDLFLAKYDSNGNIVWVKSAGGVSSNIARGNDVFGYNNDGSVVVTGSFDGTATFGEVGNQISVTSGFSGGNIFLAKYSSNGILQWVKNVGSVDFWDEGLSLSGYIDGGIILTGYFEGTATFGEVENQISLTSEEYGTDIFIVKYNANGALN